MIAATTKNDILFSQEALENAAAVGADCLDEIMISWSITFSNWSDLSSTNLILARIQKSLILIETHKIFQNDDVYDSASGCLNTELEQRVDLWSWFS